MFDFFRKTFQKKKQKKTFKEYGYEISTCHIEGIGQVDFANWLHPFNSPKEITTSNIEFYRALVKPGAMIIDIGAYVGDTTVPMALAVGKEGLVVALEPNQYAYKILEKNATLNPAFTHIVPLCFAATSEDGEFIFNYSDASFCNGGFLSQIKKKRHGHQYTLNVTGVNLEKYLLDHYSEDLKRLELVKIDAEGYDKEILKSISNILKEYKPNLMIECYKRLNIEERHELYDIIDSFGYDLFYLDNFEKDGLKKKIGKENMTDTKHFDMLAIYRQS